MLAGEHYLKNKLADILFTVIVATKLPVEANSAIRSVAFLIQDLAEEDFSESLADKIANKISLKLNLPINNLCSSVATAKNFLNATLQKQATDLLTLQETAKQHEALSKSLADTSEKFNQATHLHAPADSEWPLLLSSGALPS
jgi:endonuclease/exonuclease/phosphatase (EEP) superfamily protein YafD